MPAEAVSAIVVGLAWALAATASTARSRLGLGRFLVELGWTLAAVALGGAVLAAATSTTWPATGLVWAASALAVAVRTRSAIGVVARASSEGYRVVTVLVVALVSVIAVIGSLVLLSAVVGWPTRLGLIANIGLTMLAVVLLAAIARSTPFLLVVSAGAGVIGVNTTFAILLVHLLFGDLSTDALTAGETFAIASITAAVSILALRPTIGALRRRLDRDRPDRARVLSRLDQLIERRAPLDEAVLQSAELLRSSLELERAEVWTITGNRLQLAAADPYTPLRTIEIDETAQRVAAVGQHGPGSWARTWIPELFGDGVAPAVAAVSYAGSLQGVLVASAGGSNEEAVVELLQDVAHRLGPVMHSASLDATLAQSLVELQERERELRASRERLVTAADNERWRIERDLHDGAQQQLVALGVNLQLARGLVESNPDRAKGLMDELIEAARATTEQLRALSHGIYPKTLQDEGIGPALDETAQRHGDVDIQVSSDGVGRLAQEIETAVYFSCNEAIANAVKHAKSSRVLVNLVAADDELLFEVADNGIGFDVGHSSGHGLNNMADRLGAVGGTLTVTSGDTGTRVVGIVPLGDQALR